MKRGVAFSITALLLTAFFTVVYTTAPGVSLAEEQETVTFRVSVMDRYLSSFNDFVEQSFRVTAYKSLSGMIANIDDTGSYFPDRSAIESNFSSCVLNGTVRGDNCSLSGARPATLPDRMAEMETVGENNMHLNVSYTVTDIALDQSFPFHVRVTANYTYKVQDQFASVTRQERISQLISIAGLPDPLFTGTAGWARTISSTNISDGEWNNDTVARFIDNRKYRYHNTSPDFRDRMLGEYGDSSSCCGIEAVLSNTVDPIDFSGTTVNASGIDHRFYAVKYAGDSASCNDTRAVEGLGMDPSKIQIDEAHLVNLNVSNDLWKSDCNP